MNPEVLKPAREAQETITFEGNLALNDRYDELNREIGEIHKERVESLLDEDGESGMLVINRDEEGKILRIFPHLIREGKGKLGQLLKNKVPAEGDYDRFVYEEYENNPQVKAIVDNYLRLEDEENDRYDGIKEIKEQKIEYYKSVSNINIFFEHLGIKTPLDDNFNLTEVKQQLESVEINPETHKPEDIEKFEILMSNIDNFLKSLREIDAGNKLREDRNSKEWRYRIDFKAINSQADEIVKKVYDLKMSQMGITRTDQILSIEANMGLNHLASLAGE